MRAKELEQRDPIMNYFCLYYAARLAIDSKPTAKDSQTYLLNLLDLLGEHVEDNRRKVKDRSVISRSSNK